MSEEVSKNNVSKKKVSKKEATKKEESVEKDEKLINFDLYFPFSRKPRSWKAGMSKYKCDCKNIKLTISQWDKHFKGY